MGKEFPPRGPHQNISNPAQIPLFSGPMGPRLKSVHQISRSGPFSPKRIRPLYPPKNGVSFLTNPGIPKAPPSGPKNNLPGGATHPEWPQFPPLTKFLIRRPPFRYNRVRGNNPTLVANQLAILFPGQSSFKNTGP